MKRIPFLIALILILGLNACQSDYKFTLNSPKKIQINQELSIELKEKNDLPFDSVRFYIDGKELEGSSSKLSMDISKETLGKHLLSAVVSYDGIEKKINQEIYFLNDFSPKAYDFEIINTYSHDPKAFTQGLEFYNGYLYETTGQYGESSLRKVEIESGKVLQKQNLSDAFFGEGMTIYDQNIYVLTWRAKKGLIFDLNSLEPKGEFPYGQSKEGWGLTHSEKELIKSDGTENIYFLDPENQKEKRKIQAYTHSRKVEKLNELELVEGVIYANIWQQNGILMIDPNNGAILGVADLSGLKKQIKNNGDIDQVLNGIAYDAVNKRLFVTGKNWNKLFEIKLIAK